MGYQASFVQDYLKNLEAAGETPPATSGLFARLNAARAEQGKPNMGFLNPWIYQNPQAFNDVKLGSITGATGVKGFAALEGWDAATGFGTPNYAEMLKAALAAGEQVIV